MKKFFLFNFLLFLCFSLMSKVSLKAKSSEDKDINCITLLKIASEKSKKDGEMVKYEKLKKLKKNYLNKYSDDHFSEEVIQLKVKNHNSKIKVKGNRYINKGLQKCGLK